VLPKRFASSAKDTANGAVCAGSVGVSPTNGGGTPDVVSAGIGTGPSRETTPAHAAAQDNVARFFVFRAEEHWAHLAISSKSRK